MEEIRKHNKQDDCWIVLFDHVYDVTEFLKNHPGGSDIILQNAGQDCSQQFQAREHSGKAWAMITDFQIGSVQDFQNSFKKQQQKYRKSQKKRFEDKNKNQKIEAIEDINNAQQLLTGAQVEVIQELELPNLCLQRSTSIQKKIQEQEIIFTEGQISLFAWVIILFVCYIFLCD